MGEQDQRNRDRQNQQDAAKNLQAPTEAVPAEPDGTEVQAADVVPAEPDGTETPNADAQPVDIHKYREVDENVQARVRTPAERAESANQVNQQN